MSTPAHFDDGLDSTALFRGPCNIIEINGPPRGIKLVRPNPPGPAFNFDSDLPDPIIISHPNPPPLPTASVGATASTVTAGSSSGGGSGAAGGNGSGAKTGAANAKAPDDSGDAGVTDTGSDSAGTVKGRWFLVGDTYRHCWRVFQLNAGMSASILRFRCSDGWYHPLARAGVTDSFSRSTEQMACRVRLAFGWAVRRSVHW